MQIRIIGEIHSSKNSRRAVINKRTKRNFVVKSKAAKRDVGMIMDQLEKQRGTWETLAQGKDFPLYVNFCFVRKTKARWDFSNMVQGVADAMVQIGYIPDDDVEHFIPVYVQHKIDKIFPGVVFWISDKIKTAGG